MLYLTFECNKLPTKGKGESDTLYFALCKEDSMVVLAVLKRGLD